MPCGISQKHGASSELVFLQLPGLLPMHGWESSGGMWIRPGQN
jgi:hypothetical protein